MEVARRGEHTAILIDDLSLNPPENPAGGVAARSRSLGVRLQRRESLCCSRWRLAAEDEGDRGSLGFAISRGYGRNSSRGTRNPTLQRVRTGQPVGTREEIDLRVGGCRIIINWPLSKVEDLGAIRLCLFLFAHTLRPRRSGFFSFRLNKRSPRRLDAR